VTTLDVPCDGRATFHRLGVQGLRESLLADEKRHPTMMVDMVVPHRGAEMIETYLRPIAYLARGIGP
jgi:predicted dienelactone hydrolase